MTAMKQLNSIVDRRYDFVFLFDVQDGNPNGDPDAGNLPRIDAQTLQGFTTDGCIKRKIRNAVEVIKGVDALQPEQDAPLKNHADGKAASISDLGARPNGHEPLRDHLRYEIYFKHQGTLNEVNRRSFVALGLEAVEGTTEEESSEENEDQEDQAKKKKKKKVKDPATAPERMEKARLWMCRNFYDVRTFGAVMSTGVNAGQVRGPVQITYARSVDPILPIEASITRKSVNKKEDADKQIEKHGFITGTMGRKHTVPYALYRGNGFVNAHLAMGAKGTGFTYGDLKLFFDAMLRMFDFNPSSSQGTQALRELHVFEHSSALGNERAFKLLERVKVEPITLEANSRPPRTFDDYRERITVSADPLPSGVVYYLLPRDWEKLFPSEAQKLHERA
jgi:CRISPR-associated protein Csd2